MEDWKPPTKVDDFIKLNKLSPQKLYKQFDMIASNKLYDELPYAKKKQVSKILQAQEKKREAQTKQDSILIQMRNQIEKIIDEGSQLDFKKLYDKIEQEYVQNMAKLSMSRISRDRTLGHNTNSVNNLSSFQNTVSHYKKGRNQSLEDSKEDDSLFNTKDHGLSKDTNQRKSTQILLGDEHDSSEESSEHPRKSKRDSVCSSQDTVGVQMIKIQQSN